MKNSQLKAMWAKSTRIQRNKIIDLGSEHQMRPDDRDEFLKTEWNMLPEWGIRVIQNSQLVSDKGHVHNLHSYWGGLYCSMPNCPTLKYRQPTKIPK